MLQSARCILLTFGFRGRFVDVTSGCEYSGGHKRNLMWGKGTFKSPTAVVIGDWKTNVQHGFCEIHWTDGTHFRGNYRYGWRKNYGEVTWPDGAQYRGQWLDNHRHGKGSMTFTNGIVWQGDYVHDARHGPGVLTWPNGDTFHGTWERGRRLGRGTFTDALTGATHDQIWNEPANVRYNLGAAKWP